MVCVAKTRKYCCNVDPMIATRLRLRTHSIYGRLHVTCDHGIYSVTLDNMPWSHIHVKLRGKNFTSLKCSLPVPSSKHHVDPVIDVD